MAEKRLRGRPIALDTNAASADPALPAFLARPAGAPVYHGFPLIKEVALDGWRLGLITDSIGTTDAAGDAYVVAPDGRRAGIAWWVATPPSFKVAIGPEPGRFGVFAVGTTVGPTSIDNARAFLAAVLPMVMDEWQRTRDIREH